MDFIKFFIEVREAPFRVGVEGKRRRCADAFGVIVTNKREHVIGELHATGGGHIVVT
ncbi:unannotated protein [freshwater metagenome]|uniref:Unannotated protein n=1 Tax=freshwater metagenome TaxID=449393 RepID=A0A6J6E804_9ZZZZ